MPWTTNILPTIDIENDASTVLGDLSAEGFQMYTDMTPCFWNHIKEVTGCCDGQREWYVSNGVATQSIETDGGLLKFGVVLNTLPTPNKYVFANEVAVGLFEQTPPCLPPAKVTPTDIATEVSDYFYGGGTEGSVGGEADQASFGAGLLNVLPKGFPLWALILLLVVVLRD